MEIRVVEVKALVLDKDEIEKLKTCLKWFLGSQTLNLVEAQKFAEYVVKKLGE